MTKKLERQVTLDFECFDIDGEVSVTLWGGGQDSIEMETICLTEEDVRNNNLTFNDNGFGVESINEAITLKIFARYGNRHYVFLKQLSDVEPQDVLDILKQYLD